MGHKVHPKIHRLPVLFLWPSRWVAKSGYAERVAEDVKVRDFLKEKYKDAQIDAIYIERGAKNLTVTIFAGKPGVIIGRGGAGLDAARKDIERKFLHLKTKVKLNIQEVGSPSLSAQIVADSMVRDTEARLPFRRVMKQHMERVMKAGALGVKVHMSGRLNGVEIARSEMLAQGKIPLITLRSNVDYAYAVAKTIYGAIGVKVWIYKGESFTRVDKLAEVAGAAREK